MSFTKEQFDDFKEKVESELVRHGFPTLEDGHNKGMWDGLPLDLCLASEEEDPLEVAKEIMWWHDGTTLTVNNQAQ